MPHDTTTRSDTAADTVGESVTCPFCGSTDVRLEARKGSSICRALYQCAACGQPFERFG